MTARKKSKVHNECWLAVRGMPRERFVKVTDGRSWKFIADRRYDFLCHLAARANNDGTFTRGDENLKNYSPSEVLMTRHMSRRSFYRLSKDLRALGLLTWEREKNHSGRRVYRIWHKEQVSSSTFVVEEQVPSSTGTGAKLDGENEEQVPSSTGTGAKSDPYPSIPPKPNPTVLPVKDLVGRLAVVFASGQDRKGKTLLVGKKAEGIIERLSEEHGAPVVERAWSKWLDGRSFNGLKNLFAVWTLFESEFAQVVPQLAADALTALRKEEKDKLEREANDQSVPVGDFINVKLPTPEEEQAAEDYRRRVESGESLFS